MPTVGEVVGGSVREENADRIEAENPNKEILNWSVFFTLWMLITLFFRYSEIRRRGKPISAGFGIGFDRLLQSLTGVSNIRDTIPFPRWHAPEGQTNAQC